MPKRSIEYFVLDIKMRDNRRLGSMTFERQNVMRDRDAHAGFNVRF